MRWWRPIKLATGQVSAIDNFRGHPCIDITKHRHPMFNYTYTMTPHLFGSYLPQIHQNNHVMCKVPTPGMCRFQQIMSTRFTQQSLFITTCHCIIININFLFHIWFTLSLCVLICKVLSAKMIKWWAQPDLVIDSLLSYAISLTCLCRLLWDSWGS